MARLSVNIDHIASLREARKARVPDPVHAAVIAEHAGADGITVHLRQDRRHINERDLFIVRQIINVNLTLEMAPIESILQIALKAKPNMVTLVPELTTELSTERGFNLIEEAQSLEKFINQLHQSGIAVSLFIDPAEENVNIAHELMVDFIELNTSAYSEAVSFEDEIDTLRAIEKSAHIGANKGLAIAVGHGLDYRNVINVAKIPPVEEFSIGHAIVARSVFVGFEKAVAEMRDIILRVKGI